MAKYNRSYNKLILLVMLLLVVNIATAAFSDEEYAEFKEDYTASANYLVGLDSLEGGLEQAQDLLITRGLDQLGTETYQKLAAKYLTEIGTVEASDDKTIAQGYYKQISGLEIIQFDGNFKVDENGDILAKDTTLSKESLENIKDVKDIKGFEITPEGNLRLISKKGAALDFTKGKIEVENGGIKLTDAKFKQGENFFKDISGTGILVDEEGSLSIKNLQQGEINENKIVAGENLIVNQKGDVDGKAEEFNGVKFAGKTKLKYDGSSRDLDLDNAVITKVGENSKQFIKGNIKITNYNEIRGNLKVKEGSTLFLNGPSIEAKKADVNIEFLNSKTGGENSVKYKTDGSIEVKGKGFSFTASPKHLIINEKILNSNTNFLRPYKSGDLPKEGTEDFENIKFIQEALGLQPDGKYGPETARNIKKWQEARGLKITGIVDFETFIDITDSQSVYGEYDKWLSITERGYYKSGDSPKKGTQDFENIKIIQGVVGVAQTGKYNAETLNAVKGWQKLNGIEVDGLFGPQSIGTLLNDQGSITLSPKGGSATLSNVKSGINSDTEGNVNVRFGNSQHFVESTKFSRAPGTTARKPISIPLTLNLYDDDENLDDTYTLNYNAAQQLPKFEMQTIFSEGVGEEEKWYLRQDELKYKSVVKNIIGERILTVGAKVHEDYKELVKDGELKIAYLWGADPRGKKDMDMFIEYPKAGGKEFDDFESTVIIDGKPVKVKLHVVYSNEEALKSLSEYEVVHYVGHSRYGSGWAVGGESLKDVDSIKMQKDGVWVPKKKVYGIDPNRIVKGDEKPDPNVFDEEDDYGDVAIKPDVSGLRDIKAFPGSLQIINANACSSNDHYRATFAQELGKKNYPVRFIGTEGTVRQDTFDILVRGMLSGKSSSEVAELMTLHEGRPGRKYTSAVLDPQEGVKTDQRIAASTTPTPSQG